MVLSALNVPLRAQADRGDETAIMDDGARIIRYAQLRHVPTGEFKTFKKQVCTEVQQLVLADGGHDWLQRTRALLRARLIAGDHATATVTGAMGGPLSIRA